MHQKNAHLFTKVAWLITQNDLPKGPRDAHVVFHFRLSTSMRHKLSTTTNPSAESLLLQSATGPRRYKTGDIVREHGTTNCISVWRESHRQIQGQFRPKKTTPCRKIQWLVSFNLFLRVLIPIYSSIIPMKSSLWSQFPSKEQYQIIPIWCGCMYFKKALAIPSAPAKGSKDKQVQQLQS